MGRHAIVGAGAVGTATALSLVDEGHEVTMVTRSGSGPDHPGIRRVSADASDPPALAAAVGQADVLYNCANPPYHRWPELWPPMAASMLSVAADRDAVLVIMGNLYGYGPVDHPMTEQDPLASTGTKGRIRTAMWNDAFAAHRAGRVRVTEARASDFFGPGVVENSFFGRNVDRLLAGRKVYLLGDPDVPHTWTYVPDVGRTLAVLGTDERAWGRAWHVPSGPARTQRELATRFCEVAGAPAPRIGVLPHGRRLGGRARLGTAARAQGDPVPVRPAVHPRLDVLYPHLRARGDTARRRARGRGRPRHCARTGRRDLTDASSGGRRTGSEGTRSPSLSLGSAPPMDARCTTGRVRPRLSIRPVRIAAVLGTCGVLAGCSVLADPVPAPVQGTFAPRRPDRLRGLPDGGHPGGARHAHRRGPDHPSGGRDPRPR